MKLTKLPRPLRTALLSAVWNLSFGFFNFFTAVTAHSYWHLTLAAFFLLLGSARLSAAVYGNRHPAAVMKGTGAGAFVILLILAAGMFVRAKRISN